MLSIWGDEILRISRPFFDKICALCDRIMGSLTKVKD